MYTPDLERIRLNKLRQFLLRRLDLVDQQPELVATKRIILNSEHRRFSPQNTGRNHSISHLCFESMDIVDVDRRLGLLPCCHGPGVSVAAGPVTFQSLPRSR